MTQSLTLSLWPWPGHPGWWVLCPGPGNLREAQETFHLPFFFFLNQGPAVYICSTCWRSTCNIRKFQQLFWVIEPRVTHGVIFKGTLRPWSKEVPFGYAAPCLSPETWDKNTFGNEGQETGRIQAVTYPVQLQAGFCSVLFEKQLQGGIHPLNLCIDPARPKPIGQADPHTPAGITSCIQMSHGII